jgi:hypothetical protein
MERAKFPRTMQRGMFRGQYFETNEQYGAAIRALRNNRKPPIRDTVADGEVTLVVRYAGLTTTVEGKANERVLAALFDVLSSIDKRG